LLAAEAVLDIVQVVKVVLLASMKVELHIQILEQAKVQAVFQDLDNQHKKQAMEQVLV
jgi:hypothetical protein